MQILTAATEFPVALRGGVLTMGNFDGVHRGHQAILSRVITTARALRCPAVVYTFDPHPASVLAPQSGLQMLQTLAQRLRALEQLGVTATFVESFTQAFAATSAEDFLCHIIRGRFAPRALVVGYDLTFGRHRAGRVAELVQWCRTPQAPSIDCTVVEPVFAGEALISSTAIRRAIVNGEVAAAADALGRPFALEGTIVPGHGVGRQLGFPTLNMVPANALLPPEGVYITTAVLNGSENALPAATYIGRRPTFGGATMVVETYLLAPAPTAVHQMEVAFYRRLRGDLRFDTPDALKAQIAADVAAAGEFHRSRGG